MVDDDRNACRLVARLLADAGYLVLEAMTPHAALDLAGREGHDIGLLLTDVRMPRMNGLELARRFAELVPRARIMLMSGYHDHGVPPYPLLAKPFTPDELLTAVDGSLSGPAPL